MRASSRPSMVSWEKKPGMRRRVRLDLGAKLTQILDDAAERRKRIERIAGLDLLELGDDRVDMWAELVGGADVDQVDEALGRLDLGQDLGFRGLGGCRVPGRD